MAHRLYWGQFQPDFYGGSLFSQISGTLNLYNFNVEWNKSLYENNSMAKLYDGNTALANGNNATQGLVDNQLAGGALMMGGHAAPFFDESFLNGGNKLNTKLGEVYHNVSFPFVKKALESESSPNTEGTVEYWYFDSSVQDVENKNLQLRKSSGGYYLQPTDEQVNASNTGGSTGQAGYFPFNGTGQSGNAATLNYGFGQKFEFKFALTEDGQVTTSQNEKVPVEFNFSGDDDVWVFIDGHLVLDIGGDHGVVTGTINFKDLTATVSSIKNGDSIQGPVTTSFPDELKEDTDFYNEVHTLTMFYMERGLWESNMKITFNFPDENILEVGKVVNAENVNQDLFSGLFDNKKLFTYNIKTLATHFGTKEVDWTTGGNQKPTIKVTNSEGRNNVGYTAGSDQTGITFNDSDGEIHWYTNLNDSTSTHRNIRYGQIALNNPVDLSGYETFNFQFKYAYNDTPGLKYLFVSFLDENGKSILKTDYMSLSDCVTGSVNMVNNQWISVSLDLSRMLSGSGTTVKYIKLGYDWGRDIYFKDLYFKPVLVVTSTKTGFVTPQNSIPDYGSAKSGKLEIPEGAEYTSSLGNAYRIGTDGKFSLQNGESITFYDQFRRGSYMYLQEEANPLYTTTWTMYEGEDMVEVKNSTVADGTTTVSGDGLGMTAVTSNTVKDGRTETCQAVTGENDTSVNAYQNNGTKPTEDTFVFRHYTNPDSTGVTTKLKVVFTNTINVGTLEISKALASWSDKFEENQKFTFYVEFYNVGGMNLESSTILAGPYERAVDGDPIRITGIPVGTWYTIHEVKATDGSYTLESVKQGDTTLIPIDGTVTKDNEKYNTSSVDGAITTSGTTVSYTFNNSKKPVVSLTVKKEWSLITSAGATATYPATIQVQLQRSTEGGTPTKVPGYENVTLDPGYTSWSEYSYTFKDLDRNDEEGNAYSYQVVELGADENGWIKLGDKYFTASYSNVTNIETDTSKPPAYSQTITNTEIPTGYELPETGGAGTYLYTLGGIVLTAVPLVYGYSQWRRRERRAAR